VGHGYLNRPELTAERFVASEWAEGRVYRTGDLGRYLEDGRIEYVGRNDAQVKLRGYRIELGEIEAQLERHPLIREAVVVTREDGSGDRRLIAYYTLAAEPEGMIADISMPDPNYSTAAAVNAGSLRHLLAGVLPEYMVPAAYVALERFPLTPNGKVDRRALPAPAGNAYATIEYEAPIDEIENSLAQIWAEVLGLDGVGRQDHFFRLGGHSLLVLRVVSLIRQVFGVEVSLSDLFVSPSLAEMAQAIRNAVRSELPPITIAPRDRALALSFAQQRLWFLAQIEGVSQAYHIPAALRLSGELDLDALRRALDRVVFRHEALRTTFSRTAGQPVQQIASAESGFTLVEDDLSQCRDAEAELEGLLSQEALIPFDLEAGPLIRGRLITLGRGQHVLLITMHHIISDGWSMRVLIHELSMLYRAFHNRQSDPLSMPTIQYADYAAWQRRWISGDLLQKQTEYWRRTLTEAPVLLTLPTDHPRPAQQNHTGGFVEFELDAGAQSKSWDDALHDTAHRLGHAAGASFRTRRGSHRGAGRQPVPRRNRAPGRILRQYAGLASGSLRQPDDHPDAATGEDSGARRSGTPGSALRASGRDRQASA
jgi:arthrofactin-type cyclic lipopeptide synthetase C